MKNRLKKEQLEEFSPFFHHFSLQLTDFFLKIETVGFNKISERFYRCSKRWGWFVLGFFFTPRTKRPKRATETPKRRRAGGTLLKTSQILWILPALDRCLWKICRSTAGAGLYDLPYRLSSASASVNLLKLLKVGTIQWFWNAKRSSGDRLPVPICLSLIFVIVCYIHRHILNQLIWLILLMDKILHHQGWWLSHYL